MRLAVLAFALLGPAALAQPAPPHAHRLSREDGLASNTVYSILQDRHGFLWFGTDAGLSRYDGYTFDTYAHTPFEPRALAEDLVRALAEGPDGAVWIGTGGGGLSRLDPEAGTLAHFRHDPAAPTSLSDDQVGAVHVDRRGTVWVGTWGGVLNRLNAATGGFTRYPVCTGNADGFIRSIAEGEDGALWVTSYCGLYRFDPTREAPQHVLPDTGATYVSSVVPDPSGALWVGSVGRGVLRADPATGSFTEYRTDPAAPHDWQRNYVQGLTRDGEGTLWAGTRTAGLLRFDTGTKAFRRVPLGGAEEQEDTEVTALYVDRAGTVWVGVRGQGVFRLRPEALRVRTYAHNPHAPRSLSPSLVLSVEEDRRGAVWVGTYAGGLSRLDPATGEVRRYVPGRGTHGLSNQTVWDLHEARDGTLWVATTVGINRYDRARDRFEHLGLDASRGPAGGLPHVNTYALHETRDGTMWVGTWGGLARYDARAGRFVAYRHDPEDPASLSRNQVWAIEEDRRGALWLGTDGGGLNRLDRATGRFTHFRHDPTDPTSLAHDRVHDVHVGADGVLWVATSGGLSRRGASGGFRHVTTHDGLPSNLVRGIAEEADGTLWVVTAGGLARLDPRTGAVRVHGVSDGLPTSSYSHGALDRAADGTLWVGSDRGVTAFHPRSLAPAADAPAPVLTGVRVTGRPYGGGRPAHTVREVRLAPGDEVVSFEFASLAFAEPARLRYAYRLEGLERRWTQSGSRREATYAHLPPGTYTFRVRAAGPSGAWAEAEAVRVVVEPALWERAPVQVATVILILGFLGGGYRWRLQHLLREERTRTRIADDLHDDLGSQVSTVALMVELSSRSPSLPEAERSRLREAAAMGRRLVDDIRDTVWVIDAGHDDLATLVERLEQTAHQMLQGTSHSVLLPESVPDRELDLQTRRHVLLLLKEALHNVLRHACASHVVVGVSVEEGRLTVSVHDDGGGFDVETEGTGRGLGLMRNRARQLGGLLEIASAPGEGTALRLVVPLG